MTGAKKGRVREPVQVYLDEPDLARLDALVKSSELSKAEVLRLGIRRLAEEMLVQANPGASLSVLTGALDDSPSVPADLAARHDEYLYGEIA